MPAKWKPLRLLFGFGLLAALVALGLVLRATCFQLVGDFVCRVETTEKVIALSFDDGPTPEGVSAVLPVLESRGVKATFFLIGGLMARYPGEAKRLSDAGHELANHSFTHTRMIAKTRSFYRQEIAETDRLLRAEGAARPRLFRPPFGKRLIGLPLEVERQGYRMIMWDIADTSDQFGRPADYANHVLSQARPGSIILIHPMYRHNQLARDALPLILDGLVARGYRVVPVGELLATHTSVSQAQEK